MVKIGCWNVNSIKVRLEQLQSWLKEEAPDIVCLQELKCEEKSFPFEPLEDLGYNIAGFFQKTYNGVAILSKHPISDILLSFNEDPKPDQARYIEAVISLKGTALRVASVYVPNGGEMGSDKFSYKLKFLDSLYQHLKALAEFDEDIIIAGDFNVAPYEIDVYDPVSLWESTCFNHEEQSRFRKIISLGFEDSYRLLNPAKQEFSWWDYRGRGFEHNKGMRIDHILTSPETAGKLKDCQILTRYRALERASDHAPILIELKSES